MAPTNSTVLKISKNFIQETVNLFAPKSNNLSFSWFDSLIVFVTIFILNVFIGIYFNYFARKKSTTSEYLMGGRTMSIVPIVISLVASHTSANTLLSVPADVYRYGAAYLWGTVSTIIVTAVTICVYLPVFFKLRVTSVYEYLERRFDYKTRLLASFLAVMSHFLYLPIVIYVPSLAFSAATGANLHFVAASICGLCIFYSAIGGLKAVVWTDAIQFIIAAIAVFLIYILGLKSTGFLTVWKKAINSKRLDIFDFDIDPTKRDAVWQIVLGLTASRIANVSISQSCVQKYLAVPTFRTSILVVIYFGIGTTIVKTVMVFLGLLIYAQYSDCDPLASQKITTDNQLVTYFVMDISKNIPGLSGLYIAGVFSASLSTLSADLNCLAGIIYEDFIAKLSDKKFSERTATSILQLLVVICGVLCTLLIYIVEHLGSLFALGLSITGITSGSILGMFTMGIIYSGFNAKGAFYGGICGLMSMAYYILQVEYYQVEGLLNYPAKPTSTDNCNILNHTDVKATLKSLTESPLMFRISFYYYVLMGTIITLFSGFLISIVTNKDIQHAMNRQNVRQLRHILASKEIKSNNKDDVTKQL